MDDKEILETVASLPKEYFEPRQEDPQFPPFDTDMWSTRYKTKILPGVTKYIAGTIENMIEPDYRKYYNKLRRILKREYHADTPIEYVSGEFSVNSLVHK